MVGRLVRVVDAREVADFPAPGASVQSFHIPPLALVERGRHEDLEKPGTEPADEFARRNAMLLRNTVIVNFFDLCAISVPIPREGGLPAGLMLVARNGQDNRLFRIAMAVERLFGG